MFDEFERPRSWDRVDMANAVHLVACPLGSSIAGVFDMGGGGGGLNPKKPKNKNEINN